MSERLNQNHQSEKYSRRILLINAVLCTLNILDNQTKADRSGAVKSGIVGAISAGISTIYYIRAFRSLK